MAIDGRNPAFESPAMMRSMLCHYSELFRPSHWQVLERVPNRCGPASQILVVRARYGESIAIPDPPDDRSAVVAEIEGLGVDGLESLRTLLYRAEPRYIRIEDGPNWRIVPGTASDGLILRVPDDGDFPAPFAGEAPRSFSALKGDVAEQPDDALTVRFVAVPVR
jgi:hypothetical protein